jgi:hypothetical protein
MLRHIFFALALASISFSVVGAQCPELKEYCTIQACTKAGGELNEYGGCMESEGFDESFYQEEIENCNYAFDYCVENDGVIRNMSCCGPIFILLPVLILALYAGGTQ